MSQHPDQDSSAFSPSWGWCTRCGRIIRQFEAVFFLGPRGPCCSIACVSAPDPVDGINPICA